MTNSITPSPCVSRDFDDFFNRIKDQPTFLVLGSQGSGTNFLSRILISALDFSVTTDRSLIFNAAAQVYKDPTLERGKAEANRVVDSLFPGAIKRRTLPKRYFRQNQNYEGVREHLAHAYTSSPSDFANFFYSYHAFVTSGSHKALKSDDIWENLDLLPEIIPNYRILLLIRDPRDNAISIMNKNFGPCEIYHASEFVKKRMDAYIALADSAPDRSHCVKYEDLLSDPIGCAKRMEDYVGAKITPQIEEKIEQLKIKKDNHQKWKKLSKKELAASESVFSGILDRFGYERGSVDASAPSGIDMISRTVKDKLLRVPQKLRVKTLRYVKG